MLWPTTSLQRVVLVAGVESAKAVGCRRLALTITFSAERLTAADWGGTDLAHIPLAVRQ